MLKTTRPSRPRRNRHSNAAQRIDSRAKQRATVSVVLIVKNEEEVLADCLRSVAWADQIIVLDSGSTDGTIDLATRLGAEVYVRDDWDGFGIQRQRAQRYARGDYVFAIDADERVSPELRNSIEEVLRNPLEDVLYQVVLQNSFLDRPYRNGWRRETRVRFYERAKYSFNTNKVHESVDRKGATVRTLNGPLIHNSCRDYRYFLEKHLKYADYWAQQRAAEGKRSSLTSAMLHAAWSFLRLFVLQGGFLDGRYGFLFAFHLSQYVFNKYAALWHLSRQKEARVDSPTTVDEDAVRLLHGQLALRNET